ncbi:MAG: hypothetical protein ACRCYS_19675 [Beijerinckiaceae bacterium]
MPPLPVVNMFVEEAPTEETGVVLQSRPALHDRLSDIGPGPISALLRKDGVLSGALLGVSAGSFYAAGVNKGVITGTGAVSIAGNEIGAMIAAGGSLHYYNGTTLATVAYPDSASVTKVFAGGSRFWSIRADTGKIYWTPALGATVAALDFATAESLPDRLLDGLWIDDTAVLFGAESVEFWPNTSDPDLPIQPLEGRVFEKGIRTTGCATVVGSTFAWVGNDNAVYINGQEPTEISNPGLAARIEASAECRLFTCLIDGRDFLILRLDDECHAFGMKTGRWSEFTTAGSNWAPLCHADGVFGAADGKTLEWGSDHLELGGTLERRFSGGFPLNGGGAFVGNVTLRTNSGNTPYLAGDYVDPAVELRVSRDSGKTWGAWKRKTLGEQGQYRKRVQWRGLGMASRPGLLVQVRVTDPVPFRVSDLLVNEPMGGR